MNRMYRVSGWTDNDIRINYINAKDKEIQIKVLRELTLLSTNEIYEILGDLKVNKPVKVPKIPKERIVIDWEPVRKLYAQGLSDKQIYNATGIKVGTIGSWRKREKLPPNQRAAEKEAI